MKNSLMIHGEEKKTEVVESATVEKIRSNIQQELITGPEEHKVYAGRSPQSQTRCHWMKTVMQAGKESQRLL